MDGYPDKLKMCHKTGFEKSCRDLLDAKVCQGRWVNVIGKNPQTDEPINRWGCVDDQQVLLQLNFEARLIAIQAAVESRGNDTIKMLAEGIGRQERQHNEAMGVVSNARAVPAMSIVSNGHEPKLLSDQGGN